ncbi:hypothetical protein [Streptomyces sp. RKAG293]|uniref:hypothetical protein n=1 Tax=Streptomyces sp. RKAG293 TaxID=2893403 RepID=UPI0020336984|nr:hypothetical protein [Streptomyces sp. RKAG293]MCM2416707.1 hypothetical protein [Streptomyces sp. RKAG293]
MPAEATTPDLRTALAAVQAAYERLTATPRPDPRVLLDLERRTRELDTVAHRSAQAAHRHSSRTERRCAVANRGAEWIIRHYA